MKDEIVLGEIKNHLGKTRKIVVSWNDTSLATDAADWKYGVANKLEFISEEIRKTETFRTWVINDEATLLAIPDYVQDQLSFGDIELERLDYPVVFYVH